MRRHEIATAAYCSFTDAAEARAYVRKRGAPIVVKADGLAAGKGVVVAATIAEAETAIESMLVANTLGSSGARVVIEDFLEGEEASFIVMSDGRNALALATSQDHKRLLDGDRGPNTGGMEGEDAGEWVLVDCGDAVVHILQPAIRDYYNLEEIWGGKSVRLKSSAHASIAGKKASRKTTTRKPR